MKPTVVVGYDQSPAAERALIEAGREAAWRGASVQVVHGFHWIPAASPMLYTPVRIEESMKEAADEIAAHGAEVLRERYPGMSVSAGALAGLPAAVIADLARDADLLVVGRRGLGGFAGLIMGSVSLRTLARTPCPVLVVGDTGYRGKDVVVAGIDLADPSGPTLNFAFNEAGLRSAHLRVLTAWDQSGFRRYAGDDEEMQKAAAATAAETAIRLDQVLYTWRAQYPEVRVQPEVVDGSAAEVLVAAAAEADLVVVGAHRHGEGRDGVRIGPVTSALLHHADCPVAVVPRD